MKLFLGIVYGLAAQITTFIQLQGSVRYDIMKNNSWLIALIGIPVSWMYIQSVQNLAAAFNNQIWPSRIIGFGLGITVFTTMSYLMFNEPITLKTAICVGLGLLIILIQIYFK